jgi:hypothetical protein
MSVDQQDLRIWVKGLKHTWFGDANLDGAFDSLDIVSLLQTGQYEDGLQQNSTWATGDWNGDGEFDRADLILALYDGGYGQGPRAALSAVPEPMAVALMLAGFFGLAVLGVLHKRCRQHPFWHDDGGRRLLGCESATGMPAMDFRRRGVVGRELRRETLWLVAPDMST